MGNGIKFPYLRLLEDNNLKKVGFNIKAILNAKDFLIRIIYCSKGYYQKYNQGVL
jgi:hypothetical protein